MTLRYFIAALLLAGSIAAAQAPTAPEPPPNDLVQQVVDHELNTKDPSIWRYRLATRQSGTLEVDDVVQTKKGEIKHVLTRNGQPLTADQRKQEEQANQKFIHSPRAQQKQLRAADDDARQTKDMLSMLPKALTFTYAGQDANTITLSFHPNPDFHPPSYKARVFHAMDGHLIVSKKDHRIVEFSGHLTHGVSFGIFGHLDPGGGFDVHQQEMAPGCWEITRLKVDMRGRAIFFKTISVQQDETYSNFQREPETLTLAQAAEMLRE